MNLKAKIRYPPETAAQQPPAPQPHPSQSQPLQPSQQQQQQQQHYPSTQSQQSNASPSSTSFQSMSESEASIQRGPPPPPLVQNSQSTPIRSPPPHQSIPPSPSQQQQQQSSQYNVSANGSINGSPAMHELEPPQLIEPQPSMSAPMPTGAGGDRVTQPKSQDTPQVKDMIIFLMLIHVYSYVF